VNTRTTSQAWDAKIVGITQNGPFNYSVDYAPPTEISQNGDYTFRAARGQLHLALRRQAAAAPGRAKTMARPPVDKLAPTNTTASVAWGEFTQVYGGNVDLKPYSAVQADVSLEWYYAKNSIFNVAVFQKDIKNQITTSWEPTRTSACPATSST
jgi:hypothetical protein